MFLFKGGKRLLRCVLTVHRNDRSPKSAENSTPGLPSPGETLDALYKPSPIEFLYGVNTNHGSRRKLLEAPNRGRTHPGEGEALAMKPFAEACLPKIE
jgi:hypothetical protein